MPDAEAPVFGVADPTKHGALNRGIYSGRFNREGGRFLGGWMLSRFSWTAVLTVLTVATSTKTKVRLQVAGELEARPGPDRPSQ